MFCVKFEPLEYLSALVPVPGKASSFDDLQNQHTDQHDEKTTTKTKEDACSDITHKKTLTHTDKESCRYRNSCYAPLLLRFL